MSRRRFCFLGAGVLITGAADPLALLSPRRPLPGYQLGKSELATSAPIGFSYHVSRFPTEAEYQVKIRGELDRAAMRRLTDPAWMLEAATHRRLVRDLVTCETIYRNDAGGEIFRISDESLRRIKNNAGEFLDPSRPPSLPTLGILWHNDRLAVLSPTT